MWTFRNLVALGLFLFGTTFLWMTAAMDGKTPPPSGTAWTLANVLAYIAVIGFAIAAWGVFKQYSWWETAAVVSGVVGLVAVVPFIVGQSQLDVGFADLGADQPMDAHPGQRSGDRDRALTRRSRMGHTTPLTRRLTVRVSSRHCLWPPRGRTMTDAGGRER